MGKSRFDGTERLAFRPWQRFICIHSDVGAGDRRRPICFFSPFGSSCALCTGLKFVSFVRTQDEGAMCPKITISMMLPEILKWANSVSPGDVQLLWSTSGSWCLVWRLVEGRSSNSLAQSWQRKHRFRPPPQPAAWFWNCGAKRSCTQFPRRSCSLTKKKSVTPAKASRDQSHHTVCTEEIAETSTPFRKLAGAQKRPSRFRWNLVPRLIDTCRIRISNPLENSSTKKAKKIAP